jgi:hypothetical protein
MAAANTKRICFVERRKRTTRAIRFPFRVDSSHVVRNRPQVVYLRHASDLRVSDAMAIALAIPRPPPVYTHASSDMMGFRIEQGIEMAISASAVYPTSMRDAIRTCARGLSHDRQ